MGFLDSIKKLTIPYDDEDEFVEEERRPAAGRSAARQPEPDSAPNPFYDDVPSYDTKPSYSSAPTFDVRGAATPSFTAPKDNKVVNIHTTTQLQVVLVKPERFETAAEIADHLREKRTVVMNLESTGKDVSRRLLDFLSGVAYAQDGKIKKVAVSTYIITPYNVDIMGDLIDELENNGLYF